MPVEVHGPEAAGRLAVLTFMGIVGQACLIIAFALCLYGTVASVVGARSKRDFKASLDRVAA